jgi:CheY-like chemotaxis protein
VSAPRILIVDDSLTIRRALELILKPLGYDLDFAADGAQALERATAFTPQLVLLDYVLPDMRAPDVCAALAATPTTAFTPIILVSAKGASIRQAYQDAQNVVSYVTKPFKPQVVASVVQNALARAAASPASDGASAGAVRATPAFARDGSEPRRNTEEAQTAVAPASIEQAFAALLAQLEGAICDDATQQPNGATRNGSPFPGVSPRLRQAAARLADISQHLHGDAVVPYRLRDDGSFANVSATLLDAHRALCEAAILLAAAGAPSAVLPHSPDVLVVGPEHHGAVEEAVAAARDGGLVALPIVDQVAQLPHLVRLLAPRAVVSVRCGDAAADAALLRSLDLGEATRFIAFATVDTGDDALAARFASRVDNGDALRAAVAALGTETHAADGTPDIDLEVVAI